MVGKIVTSNSKRWTKGTHGCIGSGSPTTVLTRNWPFNFCGAGGKIAATRMLHRRKTVSYLRKSARWI
jgi:hypothetical protein